MRKIPIGVSDFKELIDEDYYYVDKTGLIRELLDSGSKITLLPRPRRFGKTLNMSMLKYFLEKSEEDTSYLFEDLYIYNCGEKYKEEQGKYPVIYFTFKDIKELDWESTYGKLQSIIIKEFERVEYVKQVLTQSELDYYYRIIQKKAKQYEYENSIFELSNFLSKYHKQKAIVIVDEYDTPMNAGHINGYTREMTNFTRGFFGAGFKDNVNLYKGIITGILRISKESIFSDMNNLDVCTILDERYGDKFGFTEKEVERLLKDYSLEDKSKEMKHWYNGYQFGKTVIYNPWSIIYFIENSGSLEPYWVNTSSNEIIRTLLKNAPNEVKSEIELLIKGDFIKKEITPNITYELIEKSEQSLWTFLVFSGYLKQQNEEQTEDGRFFELKIPNKEVLYVFKSSIIKWFEENASNRDMERMLKLLLKGDVETFTYMFKDLIEKTLSYFDPTGKEPEMFYHAFVLGMLVHLNNKYEICSNRESGYGRYDVMVFPLDKSNESKSLIIEFKKVNKMAKENMEIATKKALSQIEEKKYETELIKKGIKKENIIKLAIVFDGKEVELESVS
ncbi:AAA family ATPase [Herbivorax sp. ANBcel31]|uniref:AAA family ATPase n=1 Tax=Herbivorax sp. ANBcel31 TaxID=3069754 RepID=UPI0027B3C06B|nr:AAA family ATPase [Herbivorax sp. ANBcel31]MDQ2087437.1 AAA family ATPase [Herbivorax sp. ANBcel31]